MTADAPISLWDVTAAEDHSVSALPGDTSTDVAIVGGGFTGLSTALHATEFGLRCHVLEAGRIGQGGSGRNAGLVNAGLWLPPQDVRAALGDQAGGRLIRALGDAPSYVMSLIDRYQINCELTQTGTIHAAHSLRGVEDLARRAREWQRLGAPVELLDRDRTASMIGSAVFFGGLLDHRAGTINPMGYARGLARAARAGGATISTGVTVTAVSRVGDHWQLTTTHGVVSARTVVLATNAYSDKLWPGLMGMFIPIHYFQLATRPLGDRISHILPHRQGVWDTGKIMLSFRKDASDRLIIGSMGRIIGGDRGLSRRWALQQLHRLFPDLGPVEFEAAWHGRIAMTPDHLPRICRLAENMYAPIGYNGRGIAPGTVFGRAVAGLIGGQSQEALLLPLSAPRIISGGRLLSAFYDLAFTGSQWYRSW